MLVRKSFRYRIYLSIQQIALFATWEGALRFLWNLAHEQRRMGVARPRGERRYPTAFDQMKELTALRAELPWLAAVPRNVCAQLLVELDKAWQRCFLGLARAPRWKRKGRDFLGMTEPHPKIWRLDGNILRFPKLGNIPIRLHRPIEGKPKTCTIRRDGNHWYASISCEVDIPDPVPRSVPIVAIDRGVTNLTADSDGHLEPNPKHLERALHTLARRQRALAHRKRSSSKKGSKNLQKATARVRATHARVRRQRANVLHTLAHRYAKSHGTVVLEKLNVLGMVQNPNLARHILGAGWGKFGDMLRYKLAWSGGTFADEVAAYSSQTCAACDHVDAANRSGERFSCGKCGHEDHADINAAKVLKSRHLARLRVTRSEQPVEVTLLKGARRNRKRLNVPKTFSEKLPP